MGFNGKKACKIVFAVLLDLAILLLLIICGLFAYFKCCFSVALVSGPSMYPTLNSGAVEDVVGVRQGAGYTYADIVTCKSDKCDKNGESIVIVKRVIALAGDYVDIGYNAGNELVVYLNGKVLDEPYIQTPATRADFPVAYSGWQAYIATVGDRYSAENGGLLIGKGEVFLLGDNRIVSNDSSTLGPFPTSSVLGKVEFVYSVNENAFWQFIKQVILGIK